MRPFLSIQAGPSASIQPLKRELAWTKIDVFNIPSSVMLDKSVTASPLMANSSTSTSVLMADKDSACISAMLDQGTSPAFSSDFSPEPPAKAATQGNPINLNETSHRVT